MAMTQPPSTHQLIQRTGVWPVAVVLLLTLAVVLLQLLALPFAAIALLLDRAAGLAARPLTAYAEMIREARR